MADVYGYARETVVRDLLAVGAVAALLVVVHVGVSPAERATLAFDHGTLDVAALYTSTVVHVDASHLLNNTSGYLTAAVVTYGLCLRARSREWFLRTFVGLLVALPPLVGLTSYTILGWQFTGFDPVTRGFSGVAAGFVGFLFVALVATLRVEYGRRAGWYLGAAVWLLLLGEVSVIYGGRYTAPTVALVAVGWAVCGWVVVGERGRPTVDTVVQALGGDAVQLSLAVLLLSSFVVVLFPADIVGDGSVTNVFAHAAGLCYGVLGATLSLGVAGTERV
ncbi:hypothetical protein [Halorientalis litorea]|uniref:hypothetical protein n=1 Tax=Halorientalis litorea TaxID=2931977 RepID=UPI001FF54E9B|nr:hypothetical protein [Halorientalis litorea]